MGDGTTKGQNPPAGHFAGLRDPGNARDEYLDFRACGDLRYITTFDHSGWWGANDLLRMIVLFLVNGKLLGLLTIMFGVGLEMKYRQAKRKGKPWPGVYLWAVLFLVLEGLLHFILVMEYDILMSYGVTAIIAAFIVKGGDRLIARTMNVIGSVFAITILALAGLMLASGASVSLGSFDDVVALYQEGTWIEQVNIGWRTSFRCEWKPSS